MNPTRWIAVVTAITLGVLLLIVGLGVVSERSVIIMENVGETDVNLTVHVVNGDQFSWQGQLKSGGRVVRLARFSDNSFRVTCKDAAGEQRHAGGYVTNGLPQIVDVRVNGCSDVTIEVESLL